MASPGEVAYHSLIARQLKQTLANRRKPVGLLKVKVLCLKMQFTYILVLCTLAAAYAEEAKRPEVSDTSLDDALNDKRFIMRQLKCALGEGPCDVIGKRLKTLAPLVLRGACPQCSPQETKQIQKTLSYVQRNYPQQWAKIVRQYSG